VPVNNSLNMETSTPSECYEEWDRILDEANSQQSINKSLEFLIRKKLEFESTYKDYEIRKIIGWFDDCIASRQAQIESARNSDLFYQAMMQPLPIAAKGYLIAEYEKIKEEVGPENYIRSLKVAYGNFMSSENDNLVSNKIDKKYRAVGLKELITGWLGLYEAAVTLSVTSFAYNQANIDELLENANKGADIDFQKWLNEDEHPKREQHIEITYKDWADHEFRRINDMLIQFQTSRPYYFTRDHDELERYLLMLIHNRYLPQTPGCYVPANLPSKEGLMVILKHRYLIEKKREYYKAIFDPATSVNKGETIVNETPEQKIRRILMPISFIGSKGTVILNATDLDELVMAYVNFINDPDWRPAFTRNVRIHGTNEEFFKHLNHLHEELKLDKKGVGQMLCYYLLLNNYKADLGERMQPSTIDKNIITFKYKEE
jgi:hypothetical protein